MPRAKIDGKQTGIRMPDSLRLEIEALARPGRMAEFVRAAVEAEIARRKREDQPETPPADVLKPELTPKLASTVPHSTWIAVWWRNVVGI